jgi:putative endopeptidase
MDKHLCRLVLCVAVLASSSCTSASKSATPAVSAHAGGIDLAGMDRTVAAGDDFFAFANGTWLKTTAIPPDKSSYGIWAILNDRAEQRTRELIEGLAGSGATGSANERHVADFFASFMDDAAIEAKGLSPLAPMLQKIAAIRDRRDLAAWVCGELRSDVDALNATNFYTDHVFGLWISPPLDDPTHYEPYMLQGGLGMPDRDYYLDSSAEMARTREKYQTHMRAMLKLSGVMDPDRVARRIYDLEQKIARVHATRTESVDAKRGNNPWPRTEFATKAPGLDWNTCFDAAKLDASPRVIVWHPSAVAGISALLAKEPLDVWRDYLSFHLVEHWSAFLPKAFVDERFAWASTLSGAQQQQPRWKRGIQWTNIALGDAVGQLYVNRYFSASSKQQLQDMVRNLVSAFDRRIQALSWMNPQTKASARAKLGTLVVGIGYPDSWRDDSSLEIVRGDALLNAWRAERFDYDVNRAKLGKPVNRTEWAMEPQTVNALNLPILNALNFPAATLEPPFFDPSASVAANYGAIGAIIGHEISHSFDDQGSQFDASGKMVNWWTPEDFAHFKETSAKLVQQYNSYTPLPDLHINGQLTLSENIADLAGLAAAFDAYREAAKGQSQRQGPGGFTGDQEFFISYAQAWRSKLREPYLRQLIVTDGHAPDEFRAATVRNVDSWYDAFMVKPGQKRYLAPPDRVRVW